MNIIKISEPQYYIIMGYYESITFYDYIYDKWYKKHKYINVFQNISQQLLESIKEKNEKKII